MMNQLYSLPVTNSVGYTTIAGLTVTSVFIIYLIFKYLISDDDEKEDETEEENVNLLAALVAAQEAQSAAQAADVPRPIRAPAFLQPQHAAPIPQQLLPCRLFANPKLSFWRPRTQPRYTKASRRKIRAGRWPSLADLPRCAARASTERRKDPGQQCPS